jgi:rare lipoprotein A (peptidoglycan hydrolase)
MKIVLPLILFFCSSFIESNKPILCNATWYETKNYPKVHREYSTAAFNHYKIGDKVLVTNINNQKTDTVVITDRHTSGSNHIDLSKLSFGKIANHSQGRIKVTVKKMI